MLKSRRATDYPSELDIELQPKQLKLLDAVRKGIRHPFFGGAKGGGKSHGSRMVMLAMLMQNPGTTGLLLRRTYRQLSRNHVRPLLQQYPFMREWYLKSDQVLEIPEVSSLLEFGHCEHEEDIYNYQGIEYDYIAVEEVTQFTEFQWQMLAAHSNRPTRKGVKPVMWATGNPGGIGHLWVKRLWIDRAFREGEHPDRYVYIPSRIYDNRALIARDPMYLDVLRSIEDEQLRRAYLDGDWDIYPGQYFTQWRAEQVKVEAFQVPENWPLYGAFDYGEAAPASFGLYTINHDGIVFRISEYYQANRTATQHAEGINACVSECPWTAGRKPSMVYADPSIWTRHRMDEALPQTYAEIFHRAQIPLVRANNNRINGWRLCKDALIKNKFHAFDGWNDHFLRTVPGIPRDEKNIEDVDTDAEDHAADEWRYAMVHIYRPLQRKVTMQESVFSGNSVVDAAKQGTQELVASVYARPGAN